VQSGVSTKTLGWIGLRGAVALAVLALFVGPALLPSTYLSHRDILRLHLPLRHFLASEWQQGRLPTWFHLDGVGVSFVGSAVGAAFSPLQILVPLFPPDVALKIQVLLLLVVAGGGAARLVAGLGVGEAGRWMAAVAYAGSGYLVSATDNFTFLHGAALLPWTLDAAERLARVPSLRGGLWCGVLVALGVAGGDLQSTYLQVLLMLAWVATLSSSRPVALRHLGVGGAAGGLLVAPLLPAIAAAASESGRLGGLSAQEAVRWSLHPLRLLELVIGPLAPPGLVDAHGPELVDRLGGYNGALWVTSEALGIVVVSLAVAGAARARREGLRRYLALTLVGLLLALGSHGFLYGLFLRAVPLWSAFRYPEKLMPLVLLGAAVLAVRALQRPPERALWIALGGMAALSALTAVLAGPGTISSLLAGRQGPLDPALAETLSGHVRLQALIALLLAAAFAAALRWRPERVPWVAAGLVLVQAVLAARGQVPVRDRSELAETPALVAPLRAAGAERSRLAAWPVRYSFPGERLSAMDAAREGDRQALAPDLSALHGFGNIYSYNPGSMGAFEAACGQRPSCTSPCARRLGAGFCVVSYDEAPRWTARGARELGRLSRPKLVLLADPLARPWASFPGVRAVTDPTEIAAALRLDGPELPGLGPGPSAPAAPGAVLEWSRPRPDAAIVEVSLAEDNLLVLAENCARGWKVWVDRVPAALARVDLGLCAVRVPAGRHLVQARYVPPGWPGAWAGPMVVLLVLALAAFARERRRFNRLPSESSPSFPSRPDDARSPPGAG
jgi:hypothetical protein